MAERATLKSEDDRNDPSAIEIAFMILSALVTLALFGFLVYQAASAPQTGEPTAELLGMETLEDGSVLVEVGVHNHARQGLLVVEVEVQCDDPAPSLTFQNLPAEGRRKGTIVCPPGTTAPEVSISGWIDV